MNAKIYNGNIQPNHKEYKIWVDDDGIIKTWNGTEWVEQSGTGDDNEGSGGSGSEANDADSLCIAIYDPQFKLSAVVDIFTQTVTYYKNSLLELKNGKYEYVEHTAITENEYRDLVNEYNVSSFNNIENNIIKVNGYVLITILGIYSTPQYCECYVNDSRVNSGEC